jgi:hypothetical protein
MSSFSLRSRIGAIVGAVALAGSLQFIAAAPAVAAPPLQCQISMQLSMKVVPLTNKVEFTVVNGGGSCFADNSGTHVANVLGGTGHSNGFGPGDACPTSSTQDFSLDLNVALTSTSTGLVRTQTVTLSAPGFVALPGTAPVQVSSPGKADGAGDLSYRVYHNCPPGGENSALFVGILAN